MDDEKYLTAEQVAEALGLPSAHMVKNLTRRGKIPVCKPGYRTRLYELSEVRRALNQLTVRQVDIKRAR